MNDEKKRIAASVTILALLGLVALTWFKGGHSAVAGYDFATSLDPLDDLSRSLYLWDERLYAGAPSILTAGTLPYFLLQYLFELMAGSLYAGQMIFFTLIFTLPGLAMYWFLMKAFKDSAEKNSTAFFGAVFYMFNTFVVVKWNRGELLTLFTYALLPVYLGLIEQGLRGPLTYRFWLTLIVALFFFPASLGHTADFLILTGIVLSFGLWRGYSIGLQCLRRAACILSASIILCLWWALPLFFGLESPKTAGASFTGGDIEILHYYSSWATLLNLMKMWFFSMYSTSVEFSDQVYRPGTLLFPIIAFLSLLLMKKNRYVLFFSATAVAGLWLSKGTAPPFSSAYEWMYLNVPYFFIFRAPSRYFPVIYTLSLVVLSACTLGYLLGKTRSWWPDRRMPSIILTAFALAPVFFHSWPLFSRDTLFKTAEKDILYPSIFLDLPSEYAKLQDWFASKDGYFRLHSFNNQAYLNYTWGYSSTDISTKLLRFPQTLLFSQELTFGSGGFQGLMSAFDRSFWARDYDSVSGFLSLFGSRYITVTNDVLRRYQPHTNAPEILDAVLGESRGIKGPIEVAGAKVYENSAALPHIHVSPVAKIVSGVPDAMLTLSNTPYIERPALIMTGDPQAKIKSLSQGSVDELVFVDSNIIDLVGRNLDEYYVIRDVKDAGFEAFEPGAYIILGLKKDRRPVDLAEIRASVDGMMGQGPGLSFEGGDGIRWKSLGQWEIKTGAHHLDIAKPELFAYLVAVPLRVWDGEMEKWKGYLKHYPMNITHIIKAYGPGGRDYPYYSRGRDESATTIPLGGLQSARKTGYSEAYGGDADPSGWVVINDAADISVDNDGISFDTCLSSGEFKALKLLGRGQNAPFDPEAYPFFDMLFKTEPAGYYDIAVNIGIDDDNDGTSDNEIEAARYSSDGSAKIFNLSEKLRDRYGYPGQKSYTPVWMSFDVKKTDSSLPLKGHKSFTLSSVEFFQDIPEQLQANGKNTAVIDTPSKTGGGLTTASVKDTPSILTIRETGVMASLSDPPLPSVTTKRIGPTRYVVDLDWKGQKPAQFWLIFNESYNDGWKAYAGESGHGWGPSGVAALLKGAERYLESHETMNGYANGWWVDSCGSDGCRITIEFMPQRYFYAGAFLSGSFAGLMIIGGPLIFIISRLRKKIGG